MTVKQQKLVSVLRPKTPEKLTFGESERKIEQQYRLYCLPFSRSKTGALVYMNAPDRPLLDDTEMARLLRMEVGAWRKARTHVSVAIWVDKRGQRAFVKAENFDAVALAILGRRRMGKAVGGRKREAAKAIRPRLQRAMELSGSFRLERKTSLSH